MQDCLIHLSILNFSATKLALLLKRVSSNETNIIAETINDKYFSVRTIQVDSKAVYAHLIVFMALYGLSSTIRGSLPFEPSDIH